MTPIDDTVTNIDYYYHYLRLNRDRIVDSLKKGSNKKAINKGDLGNLLVPHPDIKIQNEIIAKKQEKSREIEGEISILEHQLANLVVEQKAVIDRGGAK